MNKRGEETRKHIKKCACSLFAEKGFKQVTMKDICEVTKLSRGGLYCHYDSTRQIFQEIIDDMTSEQDNEIDLRIKQNHSAVAILDDILNKYENEMLDSQSSLSIAIYEYFSIRDIASQNNTLYEQYLISANTWKKLIQYGMDRHEFNEVDISAVFDLIVFSYQGVRMYSKLMPMDKEIPSRIIKEIKKILVKSGSNGNKHLRLVKPTLELRKEALEYRQEHFDFGEQVINGSELFDKIDSYDEWLEKVVANASPETVDPNWVLTDTFFAVRVPDNKIVGIVDLRYQLNDFLKDFGNCGYSVRPSERRKGYAAEILRQICFVARKHGLKQLQLSVEKDNAASIKTIEKNGGKYCRSFTFENEEAYVYLIEL